MKSKQETEFVEITFWTCAVAGHRHKTKAVADACIQKHETPKEPRRKWTKEMLADVTGSAVQGKTMREVGDQYGISAGRLRQVVGLTLRRMIHPSRLDEPFPSHDYWSIQEVRQHADFWLRRLEKFRVNG